MLRASSRAGVYLDSVRLMALSGRVERLPGVTKAWLSQATEGNLEALRLKGFSQGLPEAPNALCVCACVQAESGEAAETAVALALELLVETSSASEVCSAGTQQAPLRSLHCAAKREAFSLAVLSVPGPYAAAEAFKALDLGLHVFLFSDNVSLQEEAALKKHALARNLLLMGPDCGTAVMDGHPLGFANACRRGNVGLVGASGTGLQEISCLLHRLGGGVSQLLGCGGRDLSAAIGGVMATACLRRLAADEATEVLVLVSKPPSAEVAERVLAEATAASSKPLVVCFLGWATASVAQRSGVHMAATLAEAAQVAFALATHASPPPAAPPAMASTLMGGLVLGVFCGGTLCSEAAIICRAAGVCYQGIDCGDDEFTQGRPHPMMDPSARGDALNEHAMGRHVAVLLCDCVLGFGAHADPAAVLAGQLAVLAAERARAGLPALRMVVSVTGVEEDPQPRSEAVETLRAVPGVEVADSNAAAAIAAATGAPPAPLTCIKHGPVAAAAPSSLFSRGGAFRVVAVGARVLTEALEQGGHATYVAAWAPPALGDAELGAKLARLRGCPRTAAANAEALLRMLAAQPLLVGCAVAGDVLPAYFNSHPRALLHAGPPVDWVRMSGPQRGAVIAACLLEGWAVDAEAAAQMAASGAVQLCPCHHHGCVGPMAGVISRSMALWLVRDAVSGREARAPLNEGLGRAMRFGAYGEDVLTRLRTLNGPVASSLDAALRHIGGLPLAPLMAKALHMGDELHNRCCAATGLLARALGPALVRSQSPGAATALEFMRDNDHTFLNVSMAACKLACDAASGVTGSSLVVAMARNGTDFGVRLSGTGDAWFTAPAPYVPDGLYFSQYSLADAGRDMGDSAITETYGLGGFALAAAPAIAAFVGGTAASTQTATQLMYGVALGEHGAFTIPSLDFRGCPVGIDALAVLDCGVAPIINTGIAHKEPGVGQVGAGVTAAPLECFVAALGALEAA